MKALLLLSVLIYWTAPETWAQVLWHSEIKGSASVKMQVGPDGGLYTIGAIDDLVRTPKTFSDIQLAKLSGAGELAWTAEITAPTPGPSQATQDIGSDLVFDSQGNVIITGYVNQATARHHRDVVVAKYAPDGTPLWEQQYNGSNNASDIAYRLLMDDADHIYVGATTQQTVDGKTDDVITVLKYAPDGTLVWERHYNGAEGKYDAFGGLGLTSEGTVMVIGVSYVNQLSVFTYDAPTLLVYTPDGDLLVERSLLDAFEPQYKFRVHDAHPYNGGVLVGFEVDPLTFGFDAPLVGRHLVEIDASGAIVHQVQIPVDEGWAFGQLNGVMTVDANGTAWASYAITRTDFTTGERERHLLVGTYADGAFTAHHRMPINVAATPSAIASDDEGQVYLALVQFGNPGQTGAEVAVLAYNSEGRLVGQTQVEGSASYGSGPQTWLSNSYDVSLAAAGEGQVYLSHIVNRAEGSAQLKYRETLLIDPEPVSSTALEESEQPQQVVLHQNYPNPFNPYTTIRYATEQSQEVYLAVYDLLGREVAVLQKGIQAPGLHAVTFDASSLPSGHYVYRLRTAAAGQKAKVMHLSK